MQHKDGESSLITLLVSEESTAIQQLVVSKLMNLVEVLVGEDKATIIKMVRELCEDKNWRVRHSAMQIYQSCDAFDADMVPEKVHLMFSQEEINAGLQGTPEGAAKWPDWRFFELHKDNCALIRSDWVTTVGAVAARLGQTGGKEREKAFVDDVVTKLIASTSTNSKNYLMKTVLHLATDAFVTMVAEPTRTQLLAHIKTDIGDKVPNLRLLALQTLSAVVAQGVAIPQPFKEEVSKALDAIQTGDDGAGASRDLDVVDAAKEALKALGGK